MGQRGWERRRKRQRGWERRRMGQRGKERGRGGVEGFHLIGTNILFEKAKLT